MARDMAEPRHFLSLDSAEQFFLLTYFLLDGGSHKLVSLPFFPRYSKQAPEAFHFKRFNPLLELCRKSPALASVQGDGEDECFVEFEF